MKKAWIAGGALLASLFAAGAANASVVTVDFTAEIEAIDGAGFGASGLAAGQTMTGSFSFDDAAVGVDHSDLTGFPFLSLEIVLPTTTPTALHWDGNTTTANLGVGDDIGGGGGSDAFGIVADFAEGGQFTFSAQDFDGAALSSQTLAALIEFIELGSLSDLENKSMFVTLFPDGSGGSSGLCPGPGACGVLADLTSLSIRQPSEVPLPAALPLFMAGLAGLGLSFRSKTKVARGRQVEA